MIILTSPPEINSVLGGSTPVAYDKLVIAPFTMDAVARTITGTIRLTSTVAVTMQPITGTLRIVLATDTLTIEVPQLDFYRQISLTSQQVAAVQNQIETAQAPLETGLVSLGIIAGTRSIGA